MGKKIKKSDIKLSDEELVPSTIGYMEEEKTGPWGLIILFVVFIGVALFLPEITNYVNKLMGKVDPTNTPITENGSGSGSGSGNPTPPVENTTHDFSDGLEFTYNNLKFSEFTKEEVAGKRKISFVIENSTTEDVSFEDNKYFVEIYSDNTMLGRHIIDLFEVKKSTKVSYSIIVNENEYNSINKISVIKKTTADYPKYELTNASGENYVLTCNKEDNNLVYTFNQKFTLIGIKDTLQVNSDAPDYSSSLAYQKVNASEYNNINGVASNVLESASGFVMTTDIEVSKAKIDKLSNSVYYDTKAEPNVIKFEMESRGYSCN